MTENSVNPPRDPAAAPLLELRAGAPGCTCFKLRSLSRRVTQLYDQFLAPSGLRVTQYSLIAHARRRGEAVAPTVSELAQALVTDRTTLTRNLRPLVEAGLVAVGNGADARSKAVTVTAAGEAAYQGARPLWRLAQARMDQLAGVERLNDLHVLIEAILPRFGVAHEV